MNPTLKNLVDQVKQNMRAGMSAEEAVNAVATKFGFYVGGNIYKLLLNQTRET